MPNVFFIGDTHFGHKNIIGFCRPQFAGKTIEEHDEILLDNWNKVVHHNDTVYHLGDVAWSTKAYKNILSRANGEKRLIMGNHDNYTLNEYKKFFYKVYGAKYFDQGILTHIPVNPMQLEHRFRYNIHGHLHDSRVDDPRYINVACEQINYTPIAWEDLKKKYGL
jgi:calcineurin-like phosphoesterase family protein